MLKSLERPSGEDTLSIEITNGMRLLPHWGLLPPTLQIEASGYGHDPIQELCLRLAGESITRGDFTHQLTAFSGDETLYFTHY